MCSHAEAWIVGCLRIVKTSLDQRDRSKMKRGSFPEVFDARIGKYEWERIFILWHKKKDRFY
jgi:hypothetical protein